MESPEDGCQYFFKTSLIKNEKHYIYEFWSEIIASEVGTFLGFDVLHYDVALYETKLGCLSKSMTGSGSELRELWKLLKGYDPSYDIKDKNAYTFQSIEKMLKSLFPNERFIENVIETIIFDSIIGNEDRHQENLSILVSNKKEDKRGFIKKSNKNIVINEFSQIYDSGSSLGRELNESKVEKMLSDSNQLYAYINRGSSEIHWDGETGKQKHFMLIERIINHGYKDFVKSVLRRLDEKYDKGKIDAIVDGIDDCLPEKLYSQKIPKKRKELIKKLISLRIERLKEL